LVNMLDSARADYADEPDVAQFLAACSAALKTLAVPINPDGPRQSAQALARQCGVSAPTIRKIQARLTAALAAAGIAVHVDPEAARGTAVRAGQTAGARIAAMLGAWQAGPGPAAQALVNMLDSARADAVDAPVAQSFDAWRNALQNLAVPLNPDGKRQSAHALACACGVSAPTIRHIQARLSAALEAAGIAVHADPEAARNAAVKAARARRHNPSNP
ncbi:MAG: hypothetical protein HY543_11275, partial [Deltaproteobacteria bacterium]|nr:hypothetical protein [Deltaproteobacteria bacterium]